MQTRKPAGGKKKAYHHGDLRAALMAAALELIERNGVKGFSLKDAAAMAGVSTAAPYRHFPDKEALLGEIQRQGFREFDAALTAAFESAEKPRERIIELGVAYVHYALEHPGHFRVMFGLRSGMPPEFVPQVDEPGAKGYLLLVRAVTELYPEVDEQGKMDRVLVAWSAVHGFALLKMEGAFAGMRPANDAEGQLRRSLGVLFG